MYVWPFQDIKLAAISFQNCNFSTYDLDTLNTRIPAFYFVLFSNYVINNITVNYLIIFPFSLLLSKCLHQTYRGSIKACKI